MSLQSELAKVLVTLFWEGIASISVIDVSRTRDSDVVTEVLDE